MEFLRRLAPSRENDATRAVAVLPSRFADENPLRATIGHAAPAQFLHAYELSPSLDATADPAAAHVLPARAPPDADAQRSQPASPAPLTRPTGSDYEKRTAWTHSPSEAPDIDAADAGAVKHLDGANSKRGMITGPDLKDHHGGVVLLAQHPVALPLSDAILAQRTLQSRDDSDVVHVTIGRIEVVANTALAPAVRRNPAPREGTVTLADYLRRHGGSRQ